MERVLKEFTSNIEVTPTGYSKMEITIKTFVVIKKVKVLGRLRLQLLPFPPRAWVEPDETKIRYEIIQLLPKYEDEYSFVARNVKNAIKIISSEDMNRAKEWLLKEREVNYENQD